MHVTRGLLRSSPTDLANFLVCRHKTVLDLKAARYEIARPTWDDPLAAVLRQRGQDHERAYVDRLRAEGLCVIDLTRADGAERLDDQAAIAMTLDAMRQGWDVIVQAPLGHELGLDGDGGGTADGGRFFGYADVLRRVEGESGLGAWHYEVHDTKLTTETKGGTILQLCVYSDLLETLQRRRPDGFAVVTPAVTERFRVEEFGAFYRLVSRQYGAFVSAPPDVYPHPTEHCEVCRWWDRCNARRRQDDHLTFVAGLGRGQQSELEARGVPTLDALADVPVPLPFRPTRGARETYERLREQARLQRQQRTERRPVHELLPTERDRGFCRLPEPSAGDLFLDLEGDPYVSPNGREYLFGLGRVLTDGQFCYRAWWALSEAEERTAFDELIGEVLAAIAADPALHIYHYAPYEPTAMKRLMGRFAVREIEVDALLRSGRFVDLYAVVRESLRAGVESYSIKKMEPFYAFTRDIDLQRAGDERRCVELALETGDASAISAAVRLAVEGYNRDDVRSTVELRTWLETLRHELVTRGVDVPRRVLSAGEPSEDVKDRTKRIEALRARLLAMASPDSAPEAQPTSHALRLLAFLIDWHFREDKVVWWEYFRLLEMSDEDLLEEGAAVAGLEFVEKVRDVVAKNGRPTGSEVHRYRYPPQEMELHRGDALHGREGTAFGRVDALDRGARLVDVFRGRGTLASPHPTALFAHDRIDPRIPAESLWRLAESVADHGLDADGPYGAGLSLLTGAIPRVGDQALASVPRVNGEAVPGFAVRVGAKLNRTVLPIQGPPGAGKTFTGAAMICELVRQGRRVGVTATGHKVIRHLLQAVARAAAEARQTVRLGRRPKDGEAADDDAVRLFGSTSDALAALAAGQIDVLGGTAWLWSSPAAFQTVDVLFVDEAGQMSLANVLAVSQAANSLVLLGDPQQLEQPQKGSHPDGVGVSALQHVLGAHQTLPPERGIFLAETWRLAPAICAFTSEVFYEGRLTSRPGLDAQCVLGSPRFSGAGLRVVEVRHTGCRNASDEEVEVVATIVDELLAPGVRWIDGRGEHPLTPPDILIVAPYNAHVGRLAARLGSRGVSVGTVDKFQGQEAPVVIYSMATSSPEDAPRGMEFLYSRNRLNVATSRARAVCILVASPSLFEPECRTPRQMQLANALCRYRELAPV